MLIDINLQLFAKDPDNDTEGEELDDNLFKGWDDADEDTVDDEKEDSKEEPDDDNDDEGEEDQEVAEPDKSKSRKLDEDAIYAAARRKAEKEANEKLQREREELEEQKRINAVTQNQEKIWAKADEEGVSEDAARKMLVLEEKEKIIAEREKRIRQRSMIEEQKKKLSGQKYFKELEPEIDTFITQYPDTTVEGAFHYLRSTNLDKLLDGKVKAAEKRTIANIHDRARRGVVSGSSDAGHSEDINPREILSKADLEMTNEFGVDPKKIAKRVKQHMKSKKG